MEINYISLIEEKLNKFKFESYTKGEVDAKNLIEKKIKIINTLDSKDIIKINNLKQYLEQEYIFSVNLNTEYYNEFSKVLITYINFINEILEENQENMEKWYNNIQKGEIC